MVITMDNETINRKVHEALGFMHWHSPREADYKQNAGWVCGGCYMGFHRTTPNFGNPDYCNDLNAAFRFTDKLIADGFSVSANYHQVIWAVLVYRLDDETKNGSAGLPSLARAICLAGLAALRISLQSQPEVATRKVNYDKRRKRKTNYTLRRYHSKLTFGN